MSNDNNNGKRSMKKKSISSSSVLVQLYQDRKLATKVDNMLDEGQTYEYIMEFCKEKGLEISRTTIHNYKKKREESIETGTPLLHLLDKRMKDNVTYISNKEVDHIQGKTEEGGEKGTAHVTDLTKRDMHFSDLELLDEVVRKGLKGLKQFDVVDTPLAMKAIEIRAKITNNQLQGLSLAGLREIKMRQQARDSAVLEVITQYVDPSKHDELFEDIRLAEESYYQNLDLTEEDRRATEAFKTMGIDL